MTEPSSPFPSLDGDLRRVSRVLARSADVDDSRIRAPLNHFGSNQGRLFRPTLLLSSAYLFMDECQTGETQTGDALIEAASAIQLLHLASLYHDDICDAADIRRGSATVNAAYGDAAALVAGDYLFAASFRLAAGLGAEEADIVAAAFEAICLGQLCEMYDLFNLHRSEDAYTKAIAGKTAKLMAASAQLGALRGGATEPDCRTLESFGHHVGMAFQILDDIRDIWASSDATGKSEYKDIANGVYTLPVIYALEASPELHTYLLHHGKAIDPSRVGCLLDATDAQERAMRVARQHASDALRLVTELSDRGVPDPGRIVDAALKLVPEAVPMVGQPVPAGGDRP